MLRYVAKALRDESADIAITVQRDDVVVVVIVAERGGCPRRGWRIVHGDRRIAVINRNAFINFNAVIQHLLAAADVVRYPGRIE